MFHGQGKITHITHSPSQDIVILTCQLKEIFEFMEGQFVMLQTLIDGKLVKRAYSIYSTNQQFQDNKTISFCIKRKEGGVFSTRATQVATVDMKLDIIGPVGRFVDDNVSRNYLFVSVGSGLSPCYSIYQKLIRSDNYDKIANIFGERYISHIPEEVPGTFGLQTDRIQNQIFLSKEANLENSKIPKFQSGYVQSGLDSALEFLTLHSSLFTDITVFICGLPIMCDDVSQKIKDFGIPKNRIIIEKY